MGSLNIKNVDELEQNFDNFCNSQVSSESQATLDKFVFEFLILFKNDNDFAKKYYPKLSEWFCNILSEKSDFENLITVKFHIEHFNEYIENANTVPSTKISVLDRLLLEYKLMLQANTFTLKVNEYLSNQKSAIEYCISIIEKELSQTTQLTPPQKEIKAIQLNLEQRQIIYLFQTLIDEQMINETNNQNLWHLVSQYFTDKDGNPLKNIHQNKDGLQNSKTGKPKKLAKEIQTIVTNTKNSLE